MLALLFAAPVVQDSWREPPTENPLMDKLDASGDETRFRRPVNCRWRRDRPTTGSHSPQVLLSRLLGHKPHQGRLFRQIPRRVTFVFLEAGRR